MFWKLSLLLCLLMVLFLLRAECVFVWLRHRGFIRCPQDGGVLVLSHFLPRLCKSAMKSHRQVMCIWRECGTRALQGCERSVCKLMANRVPNSSCPDALTGWVSVAAHSRKPLPLRFEHYLGTVLCRAQNPRVLESVLWCWTIECVYWTIFSRHLSRCVLIGCWCTSIGPDS